MIGDMIKTNRKSLHLTQDQLAEKADIAREMISRYENNRAFPDTETIIKIAQALSIPASALINSEEVKSVHVEQREKKSYISIPVLGTIPAGVPFEAIEDVIDYEDLPTTRFSPSYEYFGLQVKGDSMEPEYLSGDIIILRKQEDCNSGDDCAVMVNGDDATFKRVRRHDNGITLQPLNPAYSPRFFTNREIKSLPVRILGVVVEIRRRINKRGDH